MTTAKAKATSSQQPSEMSGGSALVDLTKDPDLKPAGASVEDINARTSEQDGRDESLDAREAAIAAKEADLTQRSEEQLATLPEVRGNGAIVLTSEEKEAIEFCGGYSRSMQKDIDARLNGKADEGGFNVSDKKVAGHLKTLAGVEDVGRRVAILKSAFSRQKLAALIPDDVQESLSLNPEEE